MRNGAQILFWLSIAIVLIHFVRLFETLGNAEAGMGVEFGRLPFMTRLSALFSAFAQSLWYGSIPFAAAVMVHRADKLTSMHEGAAE
jgi:hypothetical protein